MQTTWIICAFLLHLDILQSHAAFMHIADRITSLRANAQREKPMDNGKDSRDEGLQAFQTLSEVVGGTPFLEPTEAKETKGTRKRQIQGPSALIGKAFGMS